LAGVICLLVAAGEVPATAAGPWLLFEGEELWEVYFTGNVAEARTSMEDLRTYLHARFDGSEEIRSRLLHECHMSLFLIDKASGLDAHAYLHMVSSQYWQVEWLSTGPAALPPSKMADRLRGQTEAEFMEEALTRDLEATGGKGASFARQAGLYKEWEW